MGGLRILTLSLLSFELAVRLCLCQKIEAYYNGQGVPWVATYNYTTGVIRTSLLCNSTTIPIFPDDDTSIMPLPQDLGPEHGRVPLSSFALSKEPFDFNVPPAIAVWYTTNSTYNSFPLTYTSWYCNGTSPLLSTDSHVLGDYESIPYSLGAYARPLIAEWEPLESYKIAYYPDDSDSDNHEGPNSRHVYQLGVGSDHHWIDYGNLTQDAPKVDVLEFSAAYGGSGLWTIAKVRDEINIEIATLQSDDWEITTFPQPLRLVDGKNPTNATNASSLRLHDNISSTWQLEAYHGLNSDIRPVYYSNGSRTIFYAGDDSYLRQVTEMNGEWQQATRQNSTFWPKFDYNTRFGLASNSTNNLIWIYYVSGGGMVQVHMAGLDPDGQGIWQPATRLPTSVESNGTTAQATPSPTGLSTGAHIGLSTGAHIGIALGAITGLAIASIGVFLLWRRRKRNRNVTDSSAGNASESPQNEAPRTHELHNDTKIVYEIHTPLPPQEMDSDVVSSRPKQADSGTVDQHERVFEMPADPPQIARDKPLKEHESLVTSRQPTKLSI